MSDSLTPNDPAFDLDTAISADLDGELAAYAAAVDLDEAEARARMVDAPGSAHRRVAFQTARTALSTPVAPLEDFTRRRLLATASGSASDTTQSGNPRSWYPKLAAVAAAVLVVVLGAGALIAIQDQDSAKRSAVTARDTATPASGDLGDLGDISSDKVLDELAFGDRRRETRHSGTANAAGGQASSSTPEQSADREAALDLTAVATPEQVQACEDLYREKGAIRFTATGVYEGRPAIILGLANDQRTLVFVVAADDCNNVLVAISR